MGNIYLYMRKNTTKKMKIKKIQLNKTKNNRQKKKGSVVRRMTIKKQGGSATQPMTNTAVALGAANLVTHEQLGQVATLESMVAEDIERRGAFIIREIYHILRKNTMLKNKAATPIIQGLQTLFNSGTGLIFDTALKSRFEDNKQFSTYLTQMSNMMSAAVAPSLTTQNKQ